MWRFLSIYGILALSHLFFQIALAHREHINQSKQGLPKIYPNVAIIIPSYNEEADNVISCIKSCLKQRYKKPIKIYFVDDGSKDKTAVNALKKLNFKNVIIMDNKDNRGKREAQKCIFDILPKEVEIIITVDSDARLEIDAIFKLVQQFSNKKIGAVTGNVSGTHTNLLSKLIDLRYYNAFNQEREAQSYFGTVLCCCGVLSAYRRDLVDKVKEDYVNQYFLGIKCTYGDDRNLTNRILNMGYLVKFAENARATTSVPTKIKGWLKQQKRWNKSFYRELIFSIKMMFKQPRKLPAYIWYDMIMQTILPFMLLISIGLMIFNTITNGIIFLLGYLAVLVGIGIVRGSYAYFRTKDKSFFMFPLYSFLHIGLLIPVRYYALATLKDTSWGTRDFNKNKLRDYSKV